MDIGSGTKCLTKVTLGLILRVGEPVVTLLPTLSHIFLVSSN